MDVNLYIADSWNGPARKTGTAMWMLTCMIRDKEYTRKGFVTAENGTQVMGNLLAVIDAIGHLNKPCHIICHMNCGHVITGMKESRWIGWESSGWMNRRGQPVRNRELWERLGRESRIHSFEFPEGKNQYAGFMEAEIRKESGG